ncbi:hypothetical protein ACMFMG_011383 [Clarireedia jacksonii]
MCALNRGEMVDVEIEGAGEMGVGEPVRKSGTEMEMEMEALEGTYDNANLGNADEKQGDGDERVNVIMGCGNRDEAGGGDGYDDGEGVVVTGDGNLSGGSNDVASGAIGEILVHGDVQDVGMNMENKEGERIDPGIEHTKAESDVGIEDALDTNSVPLDGDAIGPPTFDTTTEDFNPATNSTHSITNDVQSSSISDKVVMVEAPIDEPSDKETENHVEPENWIPENIRFLNKTELESLEGLPAPMPSLESSPTKALTTTQDSSLADQVSCDEQIEEELVLPALPKEQGAVEVKKAEIPDSDAFTESSVQSPRELDGNGGSSPVLPKYRNAEMNDGDGDGDGDAGAGQSGRVMSSFGRRCETSDEVDMLIVDEGVGIDKVAGGEKRAQEGIGDDGISLPVTQDLAVVTEQSAEAVERLQNQFAMASGEIPANSSETYGVDEEVSTSPTQKRAKKRGRPPGRKSSGLIIDRDEDQQPAAKKTKIDELMPDPPMEEVDAEEDAPVKTPVIEKKKRGRPTGRTASHLSVNNLEDDDVDDMLVKEILAVEAISTAEEALNTNSASEELPDEAEDDKKQTVTRLLVNDSEDDEEETPSPVKMASVKAAESMSLNGGFDGQNPATEATEISFVGEAAVDQPPVQEKRRGRPAGRKASTLSAIKETAEGDSVMEDSMAIDAPSVGAGEETQQSTTSKEGDDELTNIIISTPSVEKKKRGRPAKRKASTLSTNGEEDTEAELPLDTVSDEPTLGEMIDGVDKALKLGTDFPLTSSKGGRPPESKRYKLSDNREDEVDAPWLSDPGTVEDTSMDSHISPPEKKKRERPAGRKVSEINAKTSVPLGDAHQGIDELAAGVVHEDESPNTASADKKRRGRPPLKKDQTFGTGQVDLGLEQNSDVGFSGENGGNEDAGATAIRQEGEKGGMSLDVKKRGRPSGSATEGKETTREPEPNEKDEDFSEDTKSPAKTTDSNTPDVQMTEEEGTKSSSKDSGNSAGSNASPSPSQNNDILFTELKRSKMVCLFSLPLIPCPSFSLLSFPYPFQKHSNKFPRLLVIPQIPYLRPPNRAPIQAQASRRSEKRSPRPGQRNS